MHGEQTIRHQLSKEIDNIPEQYRRGFTSNMLPGLASVEPQTAIGIVEAMEGEMRQQMTGRLIEGLADYDVNFATDYVMEMAESGDPNIAQHMKRLAKEVMETTGLEGGLDWVESLEEGALQATALRSVANEYANERPEDAAKWAEQFIGNDQNSEFSERSLESGVTKKPPLLGLILLSLVRRKKMALALFTDSRVQEPLKRLSKKFKPCLNRPTRILH